MFLPLMIDDAESKISRYHIKLEIIHVSHPNGNIDTHQVPLGARVTKELLAAVRKETCPPRLRCSLTTVLAHTGYAPAILNHGAHPTGDPAAGSP